MSGSVNLRNCKALVNGAGEGLSRAVKQKLDISETAFSTIDFNPIAVLDSYSHAQESADHRQAGSLNSSKVEVQTNHCSEVSRNPMHTPALVSSTIHTCAGLPAHIEGEGGSLRTRITYCLQDGHSRPLGGS